MDAKSIIKKLGLLPHPEGGYFFETYRSDEKISQNQLPDRYNGDRTFSTQIYFLLEDEQKSKFHTLMSDEIWNFYLGSPVIIHIISKTGIYERKILGNDLDSNQFPQQIIPKEHWFAAEILDKKSYSLVGCSVSPGFDFSDFTLGEREKLCAVFPEYSELIISFT